MTSFSASDPASKLQAAHLFMRLAATHVLSSLGLMRKRSFLQENQQIKSGYFIPPHKTWRARSSLLHWYATPVSSPRTWAATAASVAPSNSPACLLKPLPPFLTLNHFLPPTYQWPHGETKLSPKRSTDS